MNGERVPVSADRTGGSWTARVQLRVLANLVTDPRSAAEVLTRTPSAEFSRLVSLARLHGLEALLTGLLSDRVIARMDLPESVVWDLCNQRKRFIGARVRALADIRGFGEVAAQAGAAWVVVKGQALAEQLYPEPYMRHSVDVDVLVEPACFGTLVTALEASGWFVVDRNWPLLARTQPAQLRVRSPTGGLLDLHWNLVNEMQLRQRFLLPTEQLLRRRRSLPSGLPTLDPRDALIHLGVHGALSGANRLIWLADAGLLAREMEDWTELTAEARRSGTGLVLGMVLQRAHRWFGTPAPPEVLTTMGAGPIWRMQCRVMDGVSPLRHDPMRPALARSFARSVRVTQLQSDLELFQHFRQYILAGARRIRPGSPLSNAADPRSPLFESDDPDARSSYFNHVGGNH